MLVKIKILLSKENKWLGWFGDELIKLRLNTNNNPIEDELIRFLNSNLGISCKDIKVVNKENNLITLELPDEAWELFLTVVE